MYLDSNTGVVEAQIYVQLLETFAILFDLWTAGDAHFVAVFATHPESDDMSHGLVHLTTSQFENESSQKADEHHSFTKLILSVFGKKFGNIVAFFGDICQTNKAFSRRVR